MNPSDLATQPPGGAAAGDVTAGLRPALRWLLLGSAPLVAVSLALVAGAGFILAIGEDPVEFSAERWKQVLRRYPRMGRPMFDPADPKAQERLDRLAASIQSSFQPCDELRRAVAGAPLLTDDSMGGEWTQYPLD